MLDKPDILPYNNAVVIPEILLNLNIIPIRENSKLPAVEWEQYQRKIFPKGNTLAWSGNLAVVCGAVSGFLVVVDIDSPPLYEKFFSSIDTFTTTTPHGGYHLYFFDPTIEKKLPKYRSYPIDIQSNGSYVLIPPSQLEGKDYKVFRDAPILRTDVLSLLNEKLPEVTDRPKDIEDFKKLFNFNEAIQKYVVPVYSGRGYWQTLCPFHDERTPSFTIYKESYYCFGCGQTGDIINFIMQIEHLSFREAIEFLSREYAVPSPFKREIESNYFTTKGEPIYEVFVTATMAEYHIITTYDNEEMFWYCDGVYQNGIESRIKEFCERIFKGKGKPARSHFISEVTEAIRRRTYIERDRFNPPSLLNLRNCILDLNDLHTSPHTPEIIFTYCITAEYDPSKECPDFENFLLQVLKPEDIDIIQEMFGYCLWAHNNLQRAFILVGSGCNGKSTLLNVLSTILGKRNISSETLQSLSTGRFASSSLFGKLANICADIPQHPLTYTGIFKMLTGGDLLKGERKFREAFYFTNNAKLIFSTNQLPRVEDISLAFWRRWIVIEFPNSFEGRENTHLLQELITELSGIFNFVLSGYRRLLSHGEFSQPKSLSSIIEEWKKHSDSLYFFCKDRVFAEPNNSVSKEEFYNAYCNFCEEHSLTKLAKNELGKRLSQYIRVRSVRRRIGSVMNHCWEGIELKEEKDQYIL